ncbi:SigB/SigF/SigG family RNA polymerase sigma factor [bacterium]|nr:SigB/SigF/SigG family RNA polymerase sigma factor [bacterium]
MTLAKNRKQSIKVLLIKFSKTRDKQIREELILMHRELVAKLSRRFYNRGKSMESLVSVGTIGLINALDRYDPKEKAAFSTFATHYILGEIKRYFRDQGWMVQVPRSLKELNARIQKAIEKLSKELAHSPTISEISEELNVPVEKITEAMESGYAYQPISLNAQRKSDNDGQSFFLEDYIGAEDEGLKTVLERLDIKEAISSLPPREKVIIDLFFYEDFSQTEIAARLRLSQMHVSRLLRQALSRLKGVFS